VAFNVRKAVTGGRLGAGRAIVGQVGAKARRVLSRGLRAAGARGRAGRQAGDANRSDGVFRADLSGFNQVPPILSPGKGTFRLQVAGDGMSAQYELSFSNLTTRAVVSHIHFGHPTDNGGIMVFLCGGGGKPDCPGRGGTVTGTITADDVVAVPGQGVAAGDLAGVVDIIRRGLAYVNVHTEQFPDGEIRGQIVPA